jgi:hypothetical protein
MKLHTKNGWLRDLLVTLNLLKPDDKKELWARVLSDYKCQLSCLEGMKEVLGDKFVDPRDYKGTCGKDTGGRYISTKSTRQKGVAPSKCIHYTVLNVGVQCEHVLF